MEEVKMTDGWIQLYDLNVRNLEKSDFVTCSLNSLEIWIEILGPVRGKGAPMFDTSWGEMFKWIRVAM